MHVSENFNIAETQQTLVRYCSCHWNIKFLSSRRFSACLRHEVALQNIQISLAWLRERRSRGVVQVGCVAEESYAGQATSTTAASGEGCYRDWECGDTGLSPTSLLLEGSSTNVLKAGR